MREFYVTRRTRIILACVVATVVSGGFYVTGLSKFNTESYGYLFWNLALAWVPLLLTLVLERMLRTALWSSWRALLVSFLWIGFFPNAFYIVTDLSHLAEFGPDDVMYNAALFFLVVFTGMIVGFLSLQIVHKELLRRMRSGTAGVIIAAVLLFSGFAIHIGRDLRWNTWDIITRPTSLIFDVSERFIHPLDHPQTYITTLTFFTLFSVTYFVLWQFTRDMLPARPYGKRPTAITKTK